MRLPRPWPRPFWRLVKRLTPSSLFGRSLLIVVLPVALLQVAVTYVFFDVHWQEVNGRLCAALAGDVSQVVDRVSRDPDAAHLVSVRRDALEMFELSIDFEPGAVLPSQNPAGGRALSLAAFRQGREATPLVEALGKRLTQPFRVDAERYPGLVDIRVATAGGVLRILAPKDRAFASRGHIFILWLTAATILLMAVAVLFIRNQVRAIERLAQAADAFGRGQDIPFRPHGAREVRQAAGAFLAMKSRLQRHVEQRTVLLAAVSHDLRTPLTRLKLHLAMSRRSARTEAMAADVHEMEAMIDEYLAFARGEGSEGAETIRVEDLLAAVGEGARLTGVKIALESDRGLEVRGRPTALRRALANLVHNAVSHAEHVTLSAQASPLGGVEIVVDDDGPGIPPERYEDAFAPFSRLDPTRAPNAKGVGLGLAIARDVVRGHGGELTLGVSPLGGLRTRVRLP